MNKKDFSLLAKIDDQEIRADDLVQFLKLNGKFEQILDDMITDRVTVFAAKKSGISVSTEETQERFDQIRRVQGLHRAKATMEFLNNLGLDLDEFETYLYELLLKEKVVDQVTSEAAIEEYFSLNSPEFDSIEVGHIVLAAEGTAKELGALLEDDPDSFHELAKEHSLDLETRDRGGVIGTVIRGALQNELEAKVFNAEEGAVLGPFPAGDGNGFEIFKVIAKKSATLDETRKKQVAKKLHDVWLEGRAKDHTIEIP